MEEEDGDASTPFWLQSRRNNNDYFRRTISLRSRVTTVATQIFLAGCAAILIVFFIAPPFISSVSNIFRPHLVRKSWDYLNFVLVLFAVVCGFLSRNADDKETNRNNKEDINLNQTNEDINGFGYNKFTSATIDHRGGRESNTATPRYWIDDRGDQSTVYKRFSRLRSSSYPDLRLREYEGDERWRFYDDTRVNECRYESSDRIYSNRTEGGGGDDGGGGGGNKQTGSSDIEKVEIAAAAAAAAEVVEEIKTESDPPHPSLSPPPSPPRAPPQAKSAKRKKTKRVYQDVAPNERVDSTAETPPVLPVTPTPPPATVYQKKSNKQDKKKGGATKDFLIALRRKKKKQRQQSIDGLDLLFGGSDLPSPSNPPPPPPPPPFFQGLFSSKKGKSKRTSSNPPPPPPPPPERRRFESRASTSKIQKSPVDSKPNPAAKVTQFFGTGNESPLLPIPPPPPPPPFKMPAWKFVKRGDYVRMASNISISSDEPEDDSPHGGQSSAAASAGGSMFCPSPDVDTKADDFIARFRAGLKLEKMNSVTRGRSNLGPDESGS